MDYELLNFYQGTDDSSDPSIATLQVLYLTRAICYETYCDVPIALTEGSDDFNAYLESIAQTVLVNCPPTIPNPNYDPTLTSCWS
jgi:hypothetical protein